jgi:tungstate transport system ATP-binding protein
MGGVTMHGPLAQLPIIFDDVSITVGQVALLNRVTLNIAAGAPTILIGPNGAGKTTLLRTAMGLAAPGNSRMSGSITWGGQDIAPAHLAIVFQRPAMLRRSAGANIRYALDTIGVPRREHERRVDDLLALVGLAGLGHRPARRLSGGEQQRLALARALARDPAVLFLDEPTASLDPAATKAFEDVIRAVAARGIKVVMATHDLGEARRLAGDVVLLHRGRIIESDVAPLFFNVPKTAQAKAFLAGDLLV